jgi:glycosyltransferase involved in cell wall biosynthesis
MRVLQIHNKYKLAGGEDVLFESENSLLVANGHTVEKLYFDNKEISASPAGKLKAGIQSLYNFTSEKIVQKSIDTFKPEIIHVQNFFPILSPAVFFVANRNNIPIVATINNYRLICSNAILYRDNHVCEDCIKKVFPLDGIVHKCYHGSGIQSAGVTLMSSFHKVIGTWQNRVDKFIIAMTDFGKEVFITSSLKLPREKCVLKPNFVFDAGVGENIREDFYIFFARLTEEKGVNVLLDSLKHYHYRLKIVGDGPLKDRVLDAIKDYPNVEFLGFQKLDFVMSEVKKSKAVIMPSTWYEALPLSVLGTLSTGTPTIISDLPPFRELITSEYDGFHFKTGSPEDLAATIKYFDDSAEEHKLMYGNARQTYLDKYTPQKNYEMLIKIYEEVISNYGTKIQSSQQ